MTEPVGNHASDGVLLALLDGERDAGLATERVHVDACAECSTRLSRLAADVARVRASIATIPIPPRRRRSTSRILRWRRPMVRAVAATIALAAVAVASPVRGWVTRILAPAPATTITRPPPATTKPPDSTRSPSSVSFAVSAPELVVRFDSIPMDGTLTIEQTDRGVVLAEIEAARQPGRDGLLVLPGELRIRNGLDSRSRYRVSVPSSVVRVRVIIAGVVRFDGSPPATVRLSQ